jgi:predicted nucleic acid-binding protein
MIVVDANVTVYFWLDTPNSALAKRVRNRDAEWAVPQLWISEFRHVLRRYMTLGVFRLGDARWHARKAEKDLEKRMYRVETDDVLKLVEQTGHAAYDCEYVALAQDLGVPLVTADRALVEAFPRTAVRMDAFAA